MLAVGLKGLVGLTKNNMSIAFPTSFLELNKSPRLSTKEHYMPPENELGDAYFCKL